MGQKAQTDRAGGGKDAEEHARCGALSEDPRVEAPEATPKGGNDGKGTVNQGGETDEAGTQCAPIPGEALASLHEGPYPLF